jgi:DNA ligase-1
VRASEAVSAERGRRAKIRRLADYLRSLPATEAANAASYLAGELPQGRIGVGPSRIARSIQTPPNLQGALTLAGLDRALGEIAAICGRGSQAARQQSLASLFSRLTPGEREFLARLLLGELRQGAVAGLVLEAIAEAVRVEPALVRRAAMLGGDMTRVASVAFEQGRDGLAQVRLRPFVPVAPMLAQAADDLDDAVSRLADAFLDFKLDGARVQVHKLGREVRAYSRRGNEVTVAVPEIVDLASALPAAELILDGEVLALREDGRPHPFQTTMRRFGRRRDQDALRRELPLRAFFFDCLLLDGWTLIDTPAVERFAALEEGLKGRHLIPRLRPANRREAREFLERSLAMGHEGLLAKDADAPYQAGGRGGRWLKVKQVHTLDLLVLAAEWGSGRRSRWLSNLHLGARGEGTGFVMLGKTFKGLTDALLAWQTEQLLAREIARDGRVVHVRPELVVEIAFNELQESPHYPAGLALRFARVKRYRSDKSAAEADDIGRVREIFARQVAYQGGSAARDRQAVGFDSG